MACTSMASDRKSTLCHFFSSLSPKGALAGRCCSRGGWALRMPVTNSRALKVPATTLRVLKMLATNLRALRMSATRLGANQESSRGLGSLRKLEGAGAGAAILFLRTTTLRVLRTLVTNTKTLKVPATNPRTLKVLVGVAEDGEQPGLLEIVLGGAFLASQQGGGGR